MSEEEEISNREITIAINGKDVQVKPLTFGDRRKIKDELGVDLFNIKQDDTATESLFKVMTFGLKKAGLTDEQIDELPLSTMKMIQEALFKGVVNRPT